MGDIVPGRGAGPAFACVIPARDEAPTVVGVVRAALGCRYVTEVVVVDDGSSDGTGDAALAAGAKVVRRSQPDGGKAGAMAAGVGATTAAGLLFCDADLIGITSARLDALCRPVVDGRATLSVGWFDYGRWNPLVVRLAPTTGQRALPRWVWDSIPTPKRRGWQIEVMINEVVVEGRRPCSAQTMAGVTHRTKRDKFGRGEGRRRTWQMFRECMSVLAVVRLRTYWFYVRSLTVERPT